MGGDGFPIQFFLSVRAKFFGNRTSNRPVIGTPKNNVFVYDPALPAVDIESLSMNTIENTNTAMVAEILFRPYFGLGFNGSPFALLMLI